VILQPFEAGKQAHFVAETFHWAGWAFISGRQRRLMIEGMPDYQLINAAEYRFLT
jgi:hypothetical protein